MTVMIGSFALLIAFVATVACVACLVAGAAAKGDMSETLSWMGRVAAILGFVALTACCGVLLYSFIAGDYSIQYVLDEHASSDNLLYQIAGLWAGREGSLLFWAWLISLFTTIVAVRRMSDNEPLDNMAVLVGQIVLLAFVGVLVFSDSNMPFTATDSMYYDENGYLTNAASMLGMNALLEHWAMAIHPPTLFIGYAGLTIPFAYAIAAAIVNDPSRKWVDRCEKFALVSWLFLSIGIGLGSVWAYVCLGWGGYWGWDPVENASLLPWLMCVALLHSFGQYRRRGTSKLWAVVCASLAFAFCVVGTFISRSGLVQSVHAFEGDPVSLVLFGVLIVASIAAGIIGSLVRKKSFIASQGAEMESMASKDGAFFLTNVVMIVMAVLLAYLTISQALPSWMPFGGTSVSSGTYNAIARPIGILFLLLMAVCPLLGWRRTDRASFAKAARVPSVCALVLFVLLVVYFVTNLLPVYDATIAGGGTAASELLSEGPSPYYNGLAVVGLAVASLLFFNSGMMLVRAVRRRGGLLTKLPSIGSGIGHVAMAVILVGLIGSNMYVAEKSGYIKYDADTDTASEVFDIDQYRLVFTSSDVTSDANQANVDYSVSFDVYTQGKKVGEITSSVTLVTATQQRKYNAGVLSLPDEDVFVVYQGTRESDDALSVDVRVNPLMNVVWLGFALLCIGMALALFGRRASVGLGQGDDQGTSAPGENALELEENENPESEGEPGPEPEAGSKPSSGE